MTDKFDVLFESLRRTDSYILAADQKAAITLAAGVTFLGIYVSIFFNIMDKHYEDIPIPLSLSVVGIAIGFWIVWFIKVWGVFVPRMLPSKAKSIVSFASIVSSFDSYEMYEKYYRSIADKSPSLIEVDLLENHWICAEICAKKMKAFRLSLTWLSLSLSISLLGLAFLAFYLQFIIGTESP
ncbi:hypothetical protein AB4138_10785 [Vibrio sp. 10N.286.52.C3]|uniref:hypothetical protein n=1 Tax=unclassified Vibrio TaxID=2614977 RepID=UPI0010BDB1E2|nr:hypothetical protein [Vibrio sp. F13]TKF72306.1 hypothetical protein FCV59_15095 [Vibrio sp. F13]